MAGPAEGASSRPLGGGNPADGATLADEDPQDIFA